MYISSLIHRSVLLLSLSITLAWSQYDMVESDGVVCDGWLVLFCRCWFAGDLHVGLYVALLNFLPMFL